LEGEIAKKEEELVKEKEILNVLSLEKKN